MLMLPLLPKAPSTCLKPQTVPTVGLMNVNTPWLANDRGEADVATRIQECWPIKITPSMVRVWAAAVSHCKFPSVLAAVGALADLQIIKAGAVVASPVPKTPLRVRLVSIVKTSLATTMSLAAGVPGLLGT